MGRVIIDVCKSSALCQKVDSGQNQLFAVQGIKEAMW